MGSKELDAIRAQVRAEGLRGQAAAKATAAKVSAQVTAREDEQGNR